MAVNQRANVLVSETFGDDPFSGVPYITLYSRACAHLLGALSTQKGPSVRSGQKGAAARVILTFVCDLCL